MTSATPLLEKQTSFASFPARPEQLGVLPSRAARPIHIIGLAVQSAKQGRTAAAKYR